MSIVSPSTAFAIAEHSICQPGRPSPQGDGQRASAGSPGFAAFHSAKSAGSLFPASTSTRAPATMSSRERPESFP
jgi:hypothetical protein